MEKIKANEGAWPKKIEDLSDDSPLRSELDEYAEDMGHGLSAAEALQKEDSPQELRTTVETVLRAMRLTERQKPDSDVQRCAQTCSVRWSVAIDDKALVEAESDTYENPLNAINISDINRRTRGSITKVIQLKKEGISQPLGHACFLLPNYSGNGNNILLQTVGLKAAERGSGLMEVMLAKILEGIRLDLNIGPKKWIDGIDATHANAASEGKRSLGDAMRLLESLGFQKSQTQNMFQHSNGCFITLDERCASTLLLPANQVSLEMQLRHRGLISDEAWETFMKTGELPNH